MRTVRFVLEPLLGLFKRLRAITMPEMKAALGTRVDMTVFRKLATLDYLTSYSHRGGYGKESHLGLGEAGDYRGFRTGKVGQPSLPRAMETGAGLI